MLNCSICSPFHEITIDFIKRYNIVRKILNAKELSDQEYTLAHKYVLSSAKIESMTKKQLMLDFIQFLINEIHD